MQFVKELFLGTFHFSAILRKISCHSAKDNSVTMYDLHGRTNLEKQDQNRIFGENSFSTLTFHMHTGSVRERKQCLVKLIFEKGISLMIKKKKK